MLLTSNYRIHVLDAYHAMQEHLFELEQALQQDAALGSWVQELTNTNEEALNDSNPRQRAFNMIHQLEYLPLQEPKEIIICAGFLGASEATLEIVRNLNKAKEAFKKAILALKSQKISLQDELLNNQFNQSHPQRNSETAKILKKSGLAQLHLKQCYRLLPILPYAPLQIGWTWAHTRSIKKITVTQAFDKLCQRSQKMQDTGIQMQIKKLTSLPDKTPLAIVQELAPHLRTNIILNNPKGDKKRIMIKGSLPIFYPAHLDTPLPHFKPPRQKCDKNKDRVLRSDVQLDPVPFLPAIRVHRYLELPPSIKEGESAFEDQD